MAGVITELFKDLSNKIPSKQIILGANELAYDHKIKYKDMTKTEKKHKILIKLILTVLSEKQQRENGQRNNNDSFKFISESSLEHIIDQSTTTLDKRFSLGNLILLEQRKHEDTVDKKDMYNNSEIIMTKSFSNQVEDFQTDEQIEKRYQEILSNYYDYVNQQF
ncbi:DUF1524 domain-containing protein [Bacillus sp. TH44]|nr:DUF1524 domain-containing protein [Bacillus sp. TH50]MBK5361835.1 DUF1524 domain-containing protein [Bacillus sp. TH44]MBK5364554.1 DUF1524 domain-containing protein [Bacillus sp. TH50]